MNLPADEEYLTAAEAAKHLRVAKKTIIQEIHRGKLEAFMVGNVFRIPVTALNAYIANQKVRPGQTVATAEEASDL